MAIDCLFLHAAKLVHCHRSFSSSLWINFLPPALLGLADLVHRQGIATEIVHMGVESVKNRTFSILSHVKEKAPRFVAIDLHWHYQSYDVIETARIIKAGFPQASIFLGGFTASFFHEEIMKNFDVIDGIIRGDAEVPIVELASAIAHGNADLFSVPNLTWRRKGRILVNPLSYVASEEDLNRLSFTNLSLVKNHAVYVGHVGPLSRRGLLKRKHRGSSGEPRVFHLPVGRGCPVQCTWCEGGMPSQRTISGRRTVVFRGIDYVVQSIWEAVALGYEDFHIAFDPYPRNPEYYLALFERIRQEKLRIECCFESFGLPTPEFIKAFKLSFPGPRSRIAVTPDVASTRLRELHKGYSYSNRALIDSLALMQEHGVFCDLFFKLGVPFETEEDLYGNLRLQREIRRRFSNVRAIRAFTIELTPGSPWHLDPEAYGIKILLNTFMDFYRHSGEKSPFPSLGYWIPGYFSGVTDAAGFEKALRNFKCRHLCPIRTNSIWGKRICDLSQLASALTDRFLKRTG
jgi:radical SAM superfamily enzyme YgiQ (UPF0313 family)